VLIDRKKFFRLFWLALVVKDFCIAKLRAPSMIKQTLKRLLRQLGWDIHRFDPESSSTAQILAAINHVGAGLVFDIGANKGQFAKDLRSAGYTGTIVSFEPLSEAHLKLEANSRGDAKWLVHTRAALGDCDGEVEINLAGNSVSSSILPMLEAHSSAARQSIYVGSERAPLARLDSLSHKYITSSSSFFVKIDAQGYEWQVLDGASETLQIASGVLLEMSLVPLYHGQHLWLDLLERMEGIGFTLWSIQRGFTDSRSGRTLQIDAIFLKFRAPYQKLVEPTTDRGAHAEV